MCQYESQYPCYHLSTFQQPPQGKQAHEKRHLDIFGAVSVTAGLMLLVYSFNSAQNIGIRSLETLELLLSSIIVLAVFLLIEYRSKAPLMPLEFVRSSIFGANTVGLLQVAAFVGMIYSDELSSAS